MSKEEVQDLMNEETQNLIKRGILIKVKPDSCLCPASCKVARVDQPFKESDTQEWKFGDKDSGRKDENGELMSVKEKANVMRRLHLSSNPQRILFGKKSKGWQE